MMPTYRTEFRPLPDNFAVIARDMSVKEIRHKWQCGKAVACRWRSEAGLMKWSRRPDLTAEQVQHLTDTMTQEDAAELVGVSIVTFRKMQRSFGVAIPQTRTVAQRKVATHKRTEKQAVAEVTRPLFNARAEYARDFLQRLDPIWRCNAAGIFNHTGQHFRFRGKVYDQNGIVQRAIDAGWNPDGWKQMGVAA